MVARPEQPLDEARSDLRGTEQRAERDRERKSAPLACRKIMRCTITLEPMPAEMVRISASSAKTGRSCASVGRRCAACQPPLPDGAGDLESGGITAICNGSATTRCSAA